MTEPATTESLAPAATRRGLVIDWSQIPDLRQPRLTIQQRQRLAELRQAAIRRAAGTVTSTLAGVTTRPLVTGGLVASAPTGNRTFNGPTVGLGRGVLAERVVISTVLDPFMALRALAAYSGLSVRTLRGYFGDPERPLPHYRVGGKILVRRSDFDAWMAYFRASERHDVDAIVDDVMTALRAGGAHGR